MEELFWGCAGIGLSIVMPALALAAMRQAATDEQLARWAPECFGTPDDIKLGALAVTEPSGGSDVRSISTRARKDGSDWVIDGQKVFIGNGGIADVHVVVATVDPEAGHRGQGVFIVPKGTPGLTMLRKLDKLGCRASHTGEIAFEDCRVPGDQLLGGEQRLRERIAKGREAERARRRTPRLRRAARPRPCSGAAPRRWAPSSGPARWSPPKRSASPAPRSSSHATTPSEREAFGEPIIENQGISFPLADLAADIDSARLLTWRAAWMAAQRVPFEHAEGSMSKLKASEVAVRARRAGGPDPAAAGATSRTSRSRSGTATPSSTRSSRAPAKSSASSSAAPYAPTPTPNRSTNASPGPDRHPNLVLGEPSHERERPLSDRAPAAVDRQRVAPVRDLLDLVTAAFCRCFL